MYVSVRPFPDVEQKKSGGPVSNEATGRRIFISTLLLSYLSLPVIAFVSLPEPLKPFCLLVAAFAGHRVLNHDAVPVTSGVRPRKNS